MNICVTHKDQACHTWTSHITYEHVISQMQQRTATYCNILQHTHFTDACGATHCNILQRTTTHCNILQHTATHSFHRCMWCRHSGNTLQCTTTHCNILQHTATYCNTLLSQMHVVSSQWQHTATHCNALQRTATYCNILQHTATHSCPRCMAWVMSRTNESCHVRMSHFTLGRVRSHMNEL